jgi:uncharacterized membrane protein
MVVDDFAGAVFALAAAVRDRQVSLDGVQRIGATIHNFANLAIADSIAEADVHSSAQPIVARWVYLNTNANDCQLMEFT